MTRRWHWQDAVLGLQRAVPLMLVAAVAAGTWWLVQSGPSLPRGVSRAPEPTRPDLVLQRAVVERFDPSGRLVTLVHGDRMQQFNATDVLIVDQLDMTVLDLRGHTLLAKSRQGTLDRRRDHVLLEGQVRVVDLAPGLDAGQAMVFRGEEIQADQRAGVLSSRRPVTLLGPRGQAQGSSLQHALKPQATELGGRVQGVLRADGAPR